MSAAPAACEDYATWPNLLREVAEVVGPEAALRLAYECGGIEGVYVPTEFNPEHPWCRAMGPEQFARLARVFGGQRVNLPRGSYVRLAKRRIYELHDEGLSKREIALTLHVTVRHVRRVLEGMPDAAEPDEKQGKLF